MRIRKLGHAVLKVRSLAVSVPFYRGVLGLNEVARYGGQMAFFLCGENHHDLALLEIGSNAASPEASQVGLYHLAFKVGDSLEELRAVRAHLEAQGVEIAGQADHRVSQALYCHDPDGIMIELYVDADPAIWRDDPGAVAFVGNLKL